MLFIHALLALQQVPAGSVPQAPYWQQRVVYQINARLDEPTYTLRGDQQVTYVNHSPDTLRTISFHLYLNAFRPGSRWSDADSVEGRRRFNDLKDPDFAFNHVSKVKIDGVAVQASWPLAPDSTIVRFRLPRTLAPGDSLVVTMDWDARPSTVPRRQGRRGRSYDFAQWYPKVVVYDRHGWEEHALYPAGEFYGEFGDFYVKLDVPKDQVVGATGVPVCGDPGWASASRGAAPVVTGAKAEDSTFGWSAHTDPETITSYNCYAKGATRLVAQQIVGKPDRKQMIWVAHDVHNFAMTMSPDYRYEGGEWNGIQVHVLYQPGDEATWGSSIVVNRTIVTLKWLDFIFGKYPWPQMTVAHRIEGGGTEFPMMQMDGSSSQGLNLHEGGHSYLMGILANNEWREGWMDEGFTSFQTAWYNELQARNDGAIRNLDYNILLDDLDGASQPVSTVSEKFRDFDTYNRMIYNRGELFLHELQRMVGDSTMLEILHRYYARWALHHVDEAAFKAVAEEVTHRDLSTFFAQWLHAVVLTDYAVARAHRVRTDSGWLASLHVMRRAPGEFPVTVAVYGASDTVRVTVDGIAEDEPLVIATKSKPERVVIDPDVVSHDWNMLNNAWDFSTWHRLISGPLPTTRYIDNYFSPRISRDRLTIGFMPVAWFNDVGGLTIGVRSHSDYLGRFEQNTGIEACGTGAGASSGTERKECDFSLTYRNPVWLRMANTSQSLTAFSIEGRAGAGIAIEQQRTAHADYGPTITLGASLNWLATWNLAYLPPALWDNGGTFEASLWRGAREKKGSWTLGYRATATGGIMYGQPGAGTMTTHRYDAQFYSRPELTGTAMRALGKRATLGLRAYAAAVFSNDPVLSQRRIFIAGADPYQTMSNPFVRSVGALLLRPDCNCRWHSPGDGNLRGYDPALSTDRLVAVNAELEERAFSTPHALASRVSAVAFVDAGYTGVRRGPGASADPAVSPPHQWLADAGVGVRIAERIGQVSWITRIEFPFYTSDPRYSIAHTRSRFGLDRLLVSFSPVIP